jgi:fatty acid desaturase
MTEVKVRRYRLYKSPHGDIVRVKLGFSWQAFFVGSLKAIVRRTWVIVAVAALVYLMAAFYGGAPGATPRIAALVLVLLVFYAAYMLFCGVNGNRWLDDSLRRRGFTMVGEERR